MTSRWDLAELADAGVSVLDCEHKTPPDAGSGHPYIAIPNLVDGRLELTSVRRITDEHLREWTRRTRPQPGDIIVTRRGRVGDSALVPEGLSCAIGQNLVILRSVTRRVDQRFLRYAARGRLWADEVDRLRNVGAVFDSLNVRDIARIRIPVPPLEEQQAIASVLGTLDDKIDSNRRLASLLEEIVAAVFRARFVDFVGVEEFEDSGIGRIPVGWKVGSLADIGLLHRQLVKGESELPYIGLDLMPRGSTVLTDWLIDDAPTGQAATFDTDDILFGKLRPYFRKVGVAPISGRCSTEILVLRPRESDLYGVLLGHVASQTFIDHCSAVSRGTRMPRAEWKDAGAFRVAIPPAAASREFSDLARINYAQIRSLTMESRALREIRDAILPGLVAGEIRVPATGDSEEVIGQGVTQLAGANP